jgi:hypothetical protein
MPFGNHHHNAQNDPAQGIFAAASALGSTYAHLWGTRRELGLMCIPRY